MRLFLILIPVLAFPQLLLVNGVELEGGPYSSMYAIFQVDYKHIKALATFELRFWMEKGNLFFEKGTASGVELFELDVETVQLSYGKLRPSFPFPQVVDEGAWLLRVGNGWVIFSDKSRSFVEMGPLIVGTGKGYGMIGALLEAWNVGMGYAISGEEGIFIFKISDLALSLNKNSIVVSLYDPKVVVSFDGKSVKSFFWNERGFLGIGPDGTKFIERVGSIYAVGEFSKSKLRVGIGIQF